MTIQQLAAYVKIIQDGTACTVEIDRNGAVLRTKGRRVEKYMTIDELRGDIIEVLRAECDRLEAAGWKGGAKVLDQGFESIITSTPWIARDGVARVVIRRGTMFCAARRLVDLVLA